MAFGSGYARLVLVNKPGNVFLCKTDNFNIIIIMSPEVLSVMGILIKFINNPRNIYHIIISYLAVSLIFSLIYYSILPLIDGIPSLKYNTNSVSPFYVNNYIDSLYFSITSQTTVGYGDIIPVNLSGKITVLLQVVFGYFYLAFTMAVFTSHFILKSDKFKSILLNFINDRKDIH